MIVTGKQRIGKSNKTLDECLEYALTRNVLIVDVNNEFGGYDLYGPDGNFVRKVEIKRLDISQIQEFNRAATPSIRRVVCLDKFGAPLDEIQVENLLKRVLSEFRNGLLFIDDFNNIFADSLPKSVARHFSNVAHRAADTILHLQSVGRVLPKMFQNAKMFRFHDQLDGVENSKEKLKEAYEIFKIGEILVKQQCLIGNFRYFIYIDKNDAKLRGRFSPAMLTEAIKEYILTHDNTLKPLLNQRNIDGSKRYNYPTAIEIKTAELYYKYNGNVYAAAA
jgi:hypothetical protein